MSLQRKVQRIVGTVEKVQGKLKAAQKMRLFFGLGIFVLLLFSQIFKGYHFELVGLLGFLPFFFYFFKRSRRLKTFMDSLLSLQQFYSEQENFQKGLLLKDLNPESMADTHLARDLDLGLFFANINYCFSKQAEDLLNHWLCQKFTNTSLVERKKYLHEIIKVPGVTRRLQLNLPDQKVDFSKIETELKRSFFPEPIAWKWLLPLSWLLLITFLVAPVPAFLWKSALLVYIGGTLSFLSKTQYFFLRLQDIQKDFSELQNKISRLENLAQRLTFTPELKKRTLSRDVKTMSTLLSFVTVRANPIVSYILNIMVPFDFILTEIAEKYRSGFASHFGLWSIEVIQIEALASLANLKFYHNTQWAQESDNSFLSVKDLAHPLLNQDMLVTNNFDPQENRVFIITGSNMSGKSTFLRALGINYCLANIGAPVFAKEFHFKPMPIVSCIRVSDSLRDGQSYFYAEVQRMKTILECARKQEIFFLIDEPLRGTNNRERLIGNKSYLQQVLALKAQGFISTHDLELTQLADDDPKIANHHFSEQWDDNDLKFDYKIKTGPSQSTNALKILEREGLYSKEI